MSLLSHAFAVADVASENTHECTVLNGTNIDAEMLLLDANSVVYNAGPNHPPIVQSASDCCQQCWENDDCNAWTFCPLEEGCGKGCTSEYYEYKSLDQIDVTSHFGPFRMCAEDERWPYLMCSLKKIALDNASLDDPPVFEDQYSSEWISGVAKRGV